MPKTVIAAQVCNPAGGGGRRILILVDKFLKLLGFRAEREWERIMNCARIQLSLSNEVELS
jgi:hypothetical protein